MSTSRDYVFDVKALYAPLTTTLPPFTSIHNTWPPQQLRKHKELPSYVSIATAGFLTHNSSGSNVLMGEPIHVIQGDSLRVTLKNSLPGTGLSLHWHGFEMEGQLEYDGVVGITQCPLSPFEEMTYNFTVNETPGTYWYHSHSGSIGVDAINVIKGPLIVHPRSIGSEAMLDSIAAAVNGSMNLFTDYRILTSYSNERVLFFSDQFLMSEKQAFLYKVGGLNPPISKNDDGFTVGTSPYDFGTCNGKLREVVHVVPGETYKLRLLNAGTMYAFRIQIDGFPMTIVAADSEPVQPYEVDEVILHAAERFDVEIKIPSDIVVGSKFWIRADTLESKKQGYQNGVRAILHITNDADGAIISRDEDVLDPSEPIEKTAVSVDERRTMNCYSNTEKNCYPIIDLQPYPHPDVLLLNPQELASEVHFVDMQFSAPPLFAHFMRVDNGQWLQHINPTKSHFLNRDFTTDHLHENTAILNLPTFSSAIIVWRNKSLMDHPIHLHGYKMEILDVFKPHKSSDCTRADCQLATKYDSTAALKEIDKTTSGRTILKDTFILPAGGAVVTRIQTKAPAVWFAHCHLESHREDGMAMIFNIGNYTAPLDLSQLPNDFPSCDTPFVQSLREHPSCTCYQNSDAILNQSLTVNHQCSFDYLCGHEISEAANLKSYKHESGVSMRSRYITPNYAIGIIVCCVIASVLIAIEYTSRRNRSKKLNAQSERPKSILRQQSDLKMAKLAKLMGASSPYYRSRSSAVLRLADKPFPSQVWCMSQSQWKTYRPGCANMLRVMEVSLLGALVGILFYDVGNKETSSGLSQKTSLLFFSVTLWTFTRMYPSIGSTHAWYHQTVDASLLRTGRRSKMIGATAAWVARGLVSISCEALWPFLHVFIAYPLAGMFGRIDACIVISLLLVMNNLCYIALGSILGVLLPNVPLGMNISTVISQTTLVAAGFYTTLPPGISLIRYVSPVYWCFSGILKTAYNTDDTFKCLKGQSDVGANDCYIEYNFGIDLMKQRGINVATSNDPHSTSIAREVMMLLLLYFMMNIIVLPVLLYRVMGKEVDEDEEKHVDENNVTVNDKRSVHNDGYDAGVDSSPNMKHSAVLSLDSAVQDSLVMGEQSAPVEIFDKRN